ncbi:MAG: DUF1343 domain-containing protein [Paludibacteraceae bacterium]|nr:DUF1343 domain-containing protein [Paludibacteraceae bacterium]
MKTIKGIILSILLIFTASVSAAKVQTGIEVLRADGFKLLEGKRVGLTTNPTGVDSHLKSTIDILWEAENVNLVALYGPEHGVRGNVHAGDVVDNEVDKKTGLKMYSLYGKTKKPTKEMMDEIDVMVYDIQDNGCRSYTYISTMGMLMEACIEHNKELVILDRPNPLGGKKIEGCLVEDGYISFVSQFKIPYLYGQTPGELAMYLNATDYENKCKLTVVKMKGWKRDMTWEETGLEWIVASPHVPHGQSAVFYPVTGIFGEFGYISIGVGYTLPFEVMGAPWISADTLAEAMNALDLPGLEFRPIYYKPYYSTFKGELCQGVQIHILDYEKARLSEVQFLVVQELMRLWPEKNWFELCNQKRFDMFDKVCGTNKIREMFGKHYQWEDIREYWYKDVEAYREASSKYYLY